MKQESARRKRPAAAVPSCCLSQSPLPRRNLAVSTQVLVSRRNALSFLRSRRSTMAGVGIGRGAGTRGSNWRVNAEEEDD